MNNPGRKFVEEVKRSPLYTHLKIERDRARAENATLRAQVARLLTACKAIVAESENPLGDPMGPATWDVIDNIVKPAIDGLNGKQDAALGLLAACEMVLRAAIGDNPPRYLDEFIAQGQGRLGVYLTPDELTQLKQALARAD